jgi:transcriptional regulator with XRE-family HTH domain
VVNLEVTTENNSSTESPIARLKKRRQPRPKKVAPSKVIKSGLGDRLRAWRKRDNLTLDQLAKKLGVGITTLSEIETNKSLPSAETLARLYKKTNLNIFYLMFQEGGMLQGEKEDPVVKAIKEVKKKKEVKQTIFNMKLPTKKASSI